MNNILSLYACHSFYFSGFYFLFYFYFFVFCSFITMSFVHHGDNKVEARKGLEAFDVED